MKNISRIGFACKFVPNEEMEHFFQSNKKDLIEKLNQKSTTIRHLDSLHQSNAYNKLYSLCVHNLETLDRQLLWLSNKPNNLRMMRVSSDFLPAFTHSKYSHLYDRDLKNIIEYKFSKIGEFARNNDIRLSFHPGQFTILNSTNEEILKNSINEFEYHTYMATAMGYGSSFHSCGFEINVHVGGKKNGIEPLIHTIENKLSPESRNLISIENDEFSYSLEDLLPLKNICAILPDFHHEWIKTGEYIDPQSDIIKHISESWRGIKPEMHYAISQESLLENHPVEERPNLENLLKIHTKSKLRAHSDFPWNRAINRYSFEFLENFDLMFEGKQKNLSAEILYQQAVDEKFIAPI